MKLLVIIPLLCFAHLLFSQTMKTSADFRKIEWLVGTWARTNTKPGRTGTEQWTKVSETEWRGFGVTLSGADTLFVEKIKLILKDGNLFYVADVPENEEPVYFKVTELTDKTLVCENPTHDFPKKIAYARDGNKLKATISGDGKSVDYKFEKQ